MNKEKITKLIFVSFFITFNYLLFSNIDLLLDSDMSSELILSQIMSEEKSILTNKWYYSTELRVLNTQLIFAPLFLLTDNYHTVRIVGVIIIELLLLIILNRFCKLTNIQYFWLFALMFIGSYSKDYLDYYIKAPHYMTYLITNFIVLILLIDLYQVKEKNKNICYIVLLCTITFISSMNGIRQVTTTFLPMLCVVVVIVLFDILFPNRCDITSKEKKIFKVIAFMFIVSILGYLYSDKILGNKYELTSGMWDVSFCLPSIEKIKDIIYAWLVSFGYCNAYGTFYQVFSLLFALTIFITSLYMCVRMLFCLQTDYHKIDCFLVFYYIISSLIMTCVFVFTNMRVITRYFSLNSILGLVVIAIYLNRYKKKTFDNFVMAFLSIYIVFNSFFLLFNEINSTTNKDLIEMTDILLEENVKEGYATFWNGNILTEISDGKIEVWSNQKNSEATWDDFINLSNGKWLQKKCHLSQVPSGKVFIIIDENDYALVNSDKIKSYCIYEGESRKLYLFDDYDQFQREMGSASIK